MFGWLKNKLRNENAKLLKQNELAAAYLCEVHREAAASGVAESAPMIADLEMIAFHASAQQKLLLGGKTLPPEVSDEQMQLNKALRTAYDQVLMGRRAFAERFGSSTEPLTSFDQKFQPNEGWKIYYSHLPN